MKKLWVIITAAVIGLLASCGDPSSGNPNNPPVNPDNKTFIVFDNTQGICTVAVYDHYQRREEDKVAEIPAGRVSEEIEWTPGISVPFYFLYRINLKGINGFTLNYVPKEIGKDQTAVRIDENKTTTITIPKLDETVSSPDELLSNSSYLLIQNNSSFSFQLHRGTSILSPDNSSASIVNSGERAQYTINPGAVSPYQLLVGADYKPLPASIVSFEAGRIYSFIFDGNVSLITEIELILENVAGSSSSSIPETPGAPLVTASDSLLTVRWTAVERAENYEVYVSTGQEPPALPEKTAAGTTTVLSGLTNKTAYYIWIKAVNNSGSSDFSPRIRGIPWAANERPAMPERPVIIPGVTQLTVNWEECGGADSYEVYINTLPTTPSAPEIKTDKTSAVINNLENNKSYYIWIRAVNNAGKSDFSPLEAGTPKIPTAAPPIPSRPVLTAGSRELAVSWQAVELAASYEIWLGTSNNSAQSEKKGGDISGGITETVITGLENETVYYVWIKAKNVAGTSGFSPAANAKPSAFIVLPVTPSLPTVIQGSRALEVSWQQAEGALFYEVWIGVTNNSANAQKHGADVSGTSITLSGLTNDTTYYIWIKAKNNTGTSGFSPRASGTPSASAATPPALQSAPTVIAGSGQLTVNWQTAEGANAYEVWAGTDTNPTLATKRGGDVSGLSSVITGLTNGTVYYVWIKAKNAIGTSNFSPMATGTPSAFNVTPQSPSVPSVSIGNGQITVAWTAVEGATAYEVWTGTVNNSASASKNGADVSESLSVTINSLTNGTTYYIWIKAKNAIGTSNFSPVASGKPIANASSPTLNAGNEQLSVTWTAIAGADQYEVFCGTGVNPPQTAVQTVTSTSAAVSGLVNGTTYNVWVRGKNSTGTGAISSFANAKPLGNMGTVTLVSGNSQFALSWSAVDGADQYEVYYNTSNSIPGSPAQTVTTNTATISGLTNGTTYYVWVKPKNANGSGAVSTAVSGKPMATPSVPTLTSGPKQLLVTWTAVAGADEYEVYYGTTSTPTTLATTTAYYVRLRAKNANGVSGYGATASRASGGSPGLYRGVEKIGTQNLAASLTYISTNAVNGDDFYIVLGADESSPPTNLSYSGKTVGITLLGYGSERTITYNNYGGVLFSINSSVTLTLDENITLVGINSNSLPLVVIDAGNLIINDKAKITGNTSSNKGGGVSVNSNGTFTMNSGEISGNTVTNSGSGVYNEGTFTMNGGKISGNTVTNSGGGVYNAGTFTMNGGEISSNNASGGNNSCGGGVFLYGGTFIMIGGKISDNICTENGGGVYVNSNGTFTMSGGEISGNNASGNFSYGGGVYVVSNGTFTKSGGTITGYASNTVNGNVVKDSSGVVQSNSGHAVYAFSFPAKRRETTAGPGVNLDSSVSGAPGGWEN